MEYCPKHRASAHLSFLNEYMSIYLNIYIYNIWIYMHIWVQFALEAGPGIDETTCLTELYPLWTGPVLSLDWAYWIIVLILSRYSLSILNEEHSNFLSLFLINFCCPRVPKWEKSFGHNPWSETYFLIPLKIRSWYDICWMVFPSLGMFRVK